MGPFAHLVITTIALFLQVFTNAVSAKSSLMTLFFSCLPCRLFTAVREAGGTVALATCRFRQKRLAPVAARARTFYNRKWSKRPSHTCKRSIHHCHHRHHRIIAIILAIIVVTTCCVMDVHCNYWHFYPSIRLDGSPQPNRIEGINCKTPRQVHVFSPFFCAKRKCQRRWSCFVIAAGNVPAEHN